MYLAMTGIVRLRRFPFERLVGRTEQAVSGKSATRSPTTIHGW